MELGANERKKRLFYMLKGKAVFKGGRALFYPFKGKAVGSERET